MTIRRCLTLAVCGAVVPGAPVAGAAERLPNIIPILGDDIAYDDLAADPREMRSVLDDHPEGAAMLRALADRARDDIGDAATARIGGKRRPREKAEEELAVPTARLT